MRTEESRGFWLDPHRNDFTERDPSVNTDSIDRPSSVADTEALETPYDLEPRVASAVEWRRSLDEVEWTPEALVDDILFCEGSEAIHFQPCAAGSCMRTIEAHVLFHARLDACSTHAPHLFEAYAWAQVNVYTRDIVCWKYE